MVGRKLGAWLGLTDDKSVGPPVGASEGSTLGRLLGLTDGKSVGPPVGASDGSTLGAWLGDCEGGAVVGDCEGAVVGAVEGAPVFSPVKSNCSHSILQLQGQALIRSFTDFWLYPIPRNPKQLTPRKFAHVAPGMIDDTNKGLS